MGHLKEGIQFVLLNAWIFPLTEGSWWWQRFIQSRRSKGKQCDPMLSQVFPRVLLLKGSGNCAQFAAAARSLPLQASLHLPLANKHCWSPWWQGIKYMCTATIPASTAIKISEYRFKVFSWNELATRMLNKGYLILYFGGGGGISNLNHIIILNELHFNLAGQ